MQHQSNPQVSLNSSRQICGIPLNLLEKTQIDIQHLLCYICKCILVKPVTCNHSNCFTNFCSPCFDNFSHFSITEKQQTISESDKKCPNCNLKIQKTQLPLIKNLLSQVILKCPFHIFGCEQKIKYEQFYKHNQNCPFESNFLFEVEINCDGCKEKFTKNQYQNHIEICQGIRIKCQKCALQIFRIHLKKHQSRECLQEQLKHKNLYLSRVEKKVEDLENRVNIYEGMFRKILKGQALALQIEFQTSFPNNFKIDKESKEVVLQKASFNMNKQKYDFLHFYVKNSIVTSSIVGLEWRIRIKSLKGNLLIGICSSLSSNSIDLVMNKYGEIKKKEINQNKYRLIRKSEVTFSEADLITFRFQPHKKAIEIINETKFIKNQLLWEQICCLGLEFYSFYSFDTLNDSLQFI